MSSSGKARGNRYIFTFLFVSVQIYNLGRGRARPTQAKEFDEPGGLQNYTESETASCISEQSELSDIPQHTSEATPSDEV
jgi:hypothetical protein